MNPTSILPCVLASLVCLAAGCSPFMFSAPASQHGRSGSGRVMVVGQPRVGTFKFGPNKGDGLILVPDGRCPAGQRPNRPFAAKEPRFYLCENVIPASQQLTHECPGQNKPYAQPRPGRPSECVATCDESYTADPFSHRCLKQPGHSVRPVPLRLRPWLSRHSRSKRR